MITYRENLDISSNDVVSVILQEMNEEFGRSDVSILGQGFEEVMVDNSLFENYVSKLAGLMPADMADQFTDLCENTKMQILQENTSGIQPITSLVMPMIRKMWPRLVTLQAFPTTVVKKPKFSISYEVPYMIAKDGSKLLLPQAINEDNHEDHISRKKIPMDPIDLPVSGYDLLASAGASVANKEYIDVDFRVISVLMEVTDATDANPETVSVNVNVALNTTTESLHQTIKASHTDGTENTDTLFVTVDRYSGQMMATSFSGKVKKINLNAFVSNEYNREVTEFGFDIRHDDIDMPSGESVAAPITEQMMKDTMAMYSVDSMAKLTEIMSKSLASKLDAEAMNVLKSQHQENVDAGKEYVASFDVRPSASFAGRPKEWREELKTVIDHVAERIKEDSYITSGVFKLIGRSLDTHLIPNTNWVSNGNDIGGVSVDFTQASYSGMNTYQVLSTPVAAKGKLRMMFVPSAEDQITVRYMPYSYSVWNHQSGYLNPNNPNVPSIMINRRHIFYKRLPLIAEIEIKNNDGKLPTA